MIKLEGEENNSELKRNKSIILSNKHILNSIVSKLMARLFGKPLLILETCQGRGIATKRYRRFGLVIAFEKDRQTYDAMLRYLHKFTGSDLLSLERCLNKFGKIIKLYSNSREFPIIIPDEPTDSTSTKGMQRLIDNNLRFHIIDVDPYGSCKPFFQSVFKLLASKSILLVTIGDMRRRFEGYEKVMGDFNIQSKGFDFESKAFREDCVLYVGAWIIKKGLEKNIGLYPVYIHDYYFHPEGVQRICFRVRKALNSTEKNQIFLECLQRDTSLEADMITCRNIVELKEGEFSRRGVGDGSTPIRLNDNTRDRMRNKLKVEIEKSIYKRLEYLISKGW